MAAPATNTQTTLAFHMIPARTLHIHVAGCGEFSAGKLQFNLYNQDGTNLLISTNNLPPVSYATKMTYSGIIYVNDYLPDSGGTCTVNGIIHMVDSDTSVYMGGWGFYCPTALALDCSHSHKWRLTANFNTGGNTLNSNTVNIINVA